MAVLREKLVVVHVLLVFEEHLALGSRLGDARDHNLRLVNRRDVLSVTLVHCTRHQLCLCISRRSNQALKCPRLKD